MLPRANTEQEKNYVVNQTKTSAYTFHPAPSILTHNDKCKGEQQISTSSKEDLLSRLSRVIYDNQ